MYNLFLCLLLCSSVRGKFLFNSSSYYSDVCKTSNRISNNNNINVFVPSELGSDQEIIVSSFDKSMLFWAVNLMESLSKLARPMEKTNLKTDHVEVLFIVFDDKTLDLCDIHFLPCWFPKDIFSPSNSQDVEIVIKDKATRSLAEERRRTFRSSTSVNSQSFPSNSFHLHSIQRLHAVSLLLGVGANVLFTEADVYWLRSPYAVVSKMNNDLILPMKRRRNGAGIYYAKASKSTSIFFSEAFESCLTRSGGHRFNCIHQAVNVLQFNGTVGYFEDDAFPWDGCLWSDMSSSERNSAYFFYGKCKSHKKMKGGGGGGFLPLLQRYDKEGMLNIKFLHFWLTSSPLPLKSDEQKRIYVGGAVNPEAETAAKRIDLSMFSNPMKIYSRINQELKEIARSSKNLPEFLERVSLHRHDLLH